MLSNSNSHFSTCPLAEISTFFCVVRVYLHKDVHKVYGTGHTEDELQSLEFKKTVRIEHAKLINVAEVPSILLLR